MVRRKLEQYVIALRVHGVGVGMLSHVLAELGPVGRTKEQNQGMGRATWRLLCPQHPAKCSSDAK